MMLKIFSPIIKRSENIMEEIPPEIKTKPKLNFDKNSASDNCTVRFFLFTFSLVLLQFSFAQTNSLKQERIDSLTLQLKKDSTHIYRFQKLRPYLSLDNRNSYINNKPVNFKGIQVGVILHENHTVALGFYAMSQNSKRPVSTKEGTIPVKKTVLLNYLTLFYQYTLLDRKHFELDIPLEIGLGGFEVKLQDTITGKVFSDKKGNIVPLGIGIQPVYKPWSWIGIAFLFGYRVVSDPGSNQNFNGLYYSIGANIDIRQIIRNTKYYLVKKKRYKKQVKEILKP
jgi:hypothetical protein